MTIKTFALTDEQILVLKEALTKMPYEKVVYLISDINSQINSQHDLSAAELGYTRSGSGVSQ
jgi:hypothetical protein